MRLFTLYSAACVLVLSGCIEKILSPDGTAASVVLAPPEGTFLIGDTLRLVATVLDAGGEQLTNRNIEWASSDPSVATVAAGLVTGVGRGSVTIYAAAEALADSAVLAVVQPFLATRVDAGPGFTCAVTAEAKAYCWGHSWGGKLGTGNDYGYVGRPALVGGGIHWAEVATGGATGLGSGFACGVSSAGEAFCWGNNPDYYGTPSESYLPLALPDTGMALSVVASDSYSCVLGLNVVRCYRGWASWATFAAPAGLKSLTAGHDHLCGLTALGAAFCWRDNSAGQLGDGTTAYRYAAVAVSGGRTYLSIDAGKNSTCAVDDVGAGWCWGENTSGQIGDGTQVSRSVPVPVSGDHRFLVISVGQSHSCGVSTEGIAYCWGSNDAGQLGDGTLEARFVPAEVAGGIHFASVSAGRSHTCGISEDGPLYCWGANGSGQLGDESTIARTSPVAVWAP